MVRWRLLSDPPKVGLLVPPLVATLAVLAPLVPPYVRWLHGGPCAPIASSASALALIATVALAPILALAIPLRRPAHAGIALFAGAALWLVPAINVTSNVALHRTGYAGAGLGPALLILIVLSVLYSVPVSFAAEVDRARLVAKAPANESFERVLAASGAWACAGATFALLFGAAQGVIDASTGAAFGVGVALTASAVLLAIARGVWLGRVYAGKIRGVDLVDPADVPDARRLPFVGEGPHLVLQATTAPASSDPYRTVSAREAIARVSKDPERGLAPSRRARNAALAVVLLEVLMFLLWWNPRSIQTASPPRRFEPAAEFSR